MCTEGYTACLFLVVLVKVAESKGFTPVVSDALVNLNLPRDADTLTVRSPKQHFHDPSRARGLPGIGDHTPREAQPIAEIPSKHHNDETSSTQGTLWHTEHPKKSTLQN
jgi:hypothetical protein